MNMYGDLWGWRNENTSTERRLKSAFIQPKQRKDLVQTARVHNRGSCGENDLENKCIVFVPETSQNQPSELCVCFLGKGSIVFINIKIFITPSCSSQLAAEK